MSRAEPETPSEFLCSRHPHAYVGCLADKDGLFAQVMHRSDEKTCVRRLLDEAAGLVPVPSLPRPAQMKELAVHELGDGKGHPEFAIWMERHCLIPTDGPWKAVGKDLT